MKSLIGLKTLELQSFQQRETLSYLNAFFLFCILLCLLGLIRFTWADEIQQKSDSIREIVPPIELTSADLFEWGMRHQGKREFALFGRQISQISETDQTEAVWMSRGKASQEVYWLAQSSSAQSAVLSLEEEQVKAEWLLKKYLDVQQAQSQAQFSLAKELGYVESSSPNHFDELAQLYLLVRESWVLRPDPLRQSEGYTFEEQRVYQAFPPYHLLAYSRMQIDSKQANYFVSDGRMTSSLNDVLPIKKSQSQAKIKSQATRQKETLHSRLWLTRPFHVGGGYVLPAVYKEDQLLEFKVLDRRFDRVGGLWSERNEWQVSNFMGFEQARVTLDQVGMIRSAEMGDGLFMIATKPQVQFKKTIYNQSKFQQVDFTQKHLAFRKRPLSLSLLQKQKARLPKEVIEQMTSSIRPRLQTCLKLKELGTNLHIVFRLNLNEQGRLISAGATHQFPWPVTQCFLKYLETLKFPKPQLALELKTQPVPNNEQGAMLVWPLTFKP